MQRQVKQTKLSIWCEYFIEGGWLLALTLIPIYFNLLSARHFEPDKATTLRALVLLMVAAALIRALELFRANLGNDSPSASSTTPTSVNPFAKFWQHLVNIPLAVPVLIYALVFIFTTFTSIVPHVSFWGSYQRLQGTYTNLSYIILFALIVTTMRRREQVERVVTISIITGLVVALYGVVQHLGHDPLPWKGDVVSRVASTMGNAIFVAAYLIMIVPLALYRIVTGINTMRQTATHQTAIVARPVSDIGWSLAYLLLFIGTITLLVTAILFGSTVQVVDFRYWWTFPGAVVVSTGLWIMPTLKLQYREKRPPLLPGILFFLYTTGFGLLFLASKGSQEVMPVDEGKLPWQAWIIISIVSIVIFYTLALLLPRRSANSNASLLEVLLQITGTLVVLALLLLTIFYSQSRGPWLGLAAGGFTFITLILWFARHRARRQHAASLAVKVLTTTLIAWALICVSTFSFLLIGNLSDTPFFNELRSKPYIGRFFSLATSAEAGTGKVRQLIWFGDEYGGGTVGLVTSDPYRTLVGWGPESMFVAFNRFYPPSLANIEARTASPDRAHQAVLDEIATKGVVGLVSYFFVLMSFAVLVWRISYHSKEWDWQVFAIACMSGVASHFIEGMTGIPIVATLTMLWVIMAITVVAGMLAGHYTLGGTHLHKAFSQEEPAEETTESAAAPPSSSPPEPQQTATSPTPPTKQRPAQQQQPSRRKRGAVGRGTSPAHSRAQAAPARTNANQHTRMHRENNPASFAAAMIFYVLIVLLALMGVWAFNARPVYADMRFHEGEAYSAQGGIAHIYAMQKFLEAIRNNPHEDFYYLNLGRSLMDLGDQLRKAERPLGKENPEASVDKLLQLETIEDIESFVQNSTPMEMMSYARAVLKQARNLNPDNKDHYANLARLHNFWYNWDNNPERLKEATEWYERVHTVAPYDVALINEHANIRMMLGNIMATQENEDTRAQAQEHFQRAAQLYETSLSYDPTFGDADIRLVELYRVLGRFSDAVAMLAQAAERNPSVLGGEASALAASLQENGNPDLLRSLRDIYLAHAKNNAERYAQAGILSVHADDMQTATQSYSRAVALAPDNLQYRQNYAIVLSDTQQYDRALDEAQAALAIAQNDGNEEEIVRFETFIAFLKQM